MRKFVLALLCVQVIWVASLSAVTGKTCSEVSMSFSHFVDIDEPYPSEPRKKELVQAQLEFMYGALATTKYKGVPRGDYEIRLLDSVVIPEGQTRVLYHYEGTILLQKGPRTKFSFPLPRTPTEKGIYQPALDTKGVNHSTDDHYQSFDDYWYFWEPTKEGSLLKEGVHYDVVNAQIERVKNRERSYPEYERLIRSNGVVRVSALFGMDEPSHSRNVNRGKDLGAIGYRNFRKGLADMGFLKEELTPSEREVIFDSHRFRGYSIERWTKETPKAMLEVVLFFGPSGISEPSRAFHYVFKDALENSSVVIYDGHSGLGAHLDLKEIEKEEQFKIKTHPNEYQIMFFNSCSSYSYYNTAYHLLKGERNPTQNLDILSNGLPTVFDETQKANLALVGAVDKWLNKGIRQSYQSLAQRMEADNLFVVSGDEDNPQ